MRVPPTSQTQGSALLGRRRPTLEKPGWRTALLCFGILILTVIAVAFMFVVTAYMVSMVRGHLHPGHKGGRENKMRSSKPNPKAGQLGLWSRVITNAENTLAPKDSDNRRLRR